MAEENKLVRVNANFPSNSYSTLRNVPGASETKATLKLK